jgi:hypothetical protein
MEDFTQKYLKYKNKYLALKSQLGGVPGFPFSFDNAGTLAIMAVVTGDVLASLTDTSIALGLPMPKNLHITLLHLHINFANRNASVFLEDKFNEIVKKSFIDNINRQGIELESTDDACDIFGQHPSLENKFWVNIFTLPERFKENISQFRKDINTYLNTVVGINLSRIENRSGVDFVVYYTSGVELYAIAKDHYYTVYSWKPHISITILKDLQLVNRGLFDEIKRIPTTKSMSDRLVQMSGINSSLNTIKMNKDIKNIIISVRSTSRGINKSNTIAIPSLVVLKADTLPFRPSAPAFNLSAPAFNLSAPAFRPSAPAFKPSAPAFKPSTSS